MSAAEPTIRVVLADDHALLREGTAELLERAGGIDVVGQAADGVEAVELVAATRPDVLLLDLAMPGLDGLEVTRRALSISPTTRVVALTAHEEQPYVLAMLQAGASGYLSKSSRGREVVQAVRAAAAGETVFSAAIARGVTRRALGESGPETPLTPRERDVLFAAARGLGNKQIAAELGMSARTVQTHLTSVFAKLGVSSRTEAVLLAVKRGWVRADLI
ncbi:MAG: response regulator transcription factor [Chloroflexi bacterium]|nr:response regulator transcription factor [Chloroflexota bacterium]MBV9598071.1 response regulator transcription factor [Chloroflexota bacterium]